jgi:hypothetical protein
LPAGDRGARSVASLTAPRAARAELSGTFRRDPSAFSIPDDVFRLLVVLFTVTPFMTDGPAERRNLDAIACGSGIDADPRTAWTVAMRQGDFTGAWVVADHVLKTRAGGGASRLPRHEQHVWDGTALDGRRVLVRCYHGLGDTLQFIRFVPWLAARCPAVTVWVQEKLIPLLSTMEGSGALLPLHDGEPDVAHDVQVELMELPHVFRVTLETLPADVPYLHAAPSAGWPRARPRIGLVWQAGDWDARRSIARPLLEPLLTTPAVTWVVMQPGADAAEWGRGDALWPTGWDLLTYARAMRSLDLLVTIDSMPAHLAGALAVPVWTLLPAQADWRWMEGRNDSPWYPTMRLFRQTTPGRWDDVIARVAGELRDRVGRGLIESDPVGSGRIRSDRVRSGLIGSDQVGSGRIGSDRVGSGLIGSDRVGSGPIGSDRVAIRVPPRPAVTAGCSTRPSPDAGA